MSTPSKLTLSQLSSLVVRARYHQLNWRTRQQAESLQNCMKNVRARSSACEQRSFAICMQGIALSLPSELSDTEVVHNGNLVGLGYNNVAQILMAVNSPINPSMKMFNPHTQQTHVMANLISPRYHACYG